MKTININGKELFVIEPTDGALPKNAVVLAYQNLLAIDPEYAFWMKQQRKEGKKNKGSFYRNMSEEQIAEAIKTTKWNQVFGNKNLFAGAYLFEGELEGVLSMVENPPKDEPIIANLVKGRGFNFLVYREKDQLPTVPYSNLIIGPNTVQDAYKEAYKKAVSEGKSGNDMIEFLNFDRPVSILFNDLECRIKAAEIGILVMYTLYPGPTKGINKVETGTTNGAIHDFDEVQIIAESSFYAYKKKRLLELLEQNKKETSEYKDLRIAEFQGENSFKAVDLDVVYEMAEEIVKNGEWNEMIAHHLVEFTRGAFDINRINITQ